LLQLLACLSELPFSYLQAAFPTARDLQADVISMIIQHIAHSDVHVREGAIAALCNIAARMSVRPPLETSFLLPIFRDLRIESECCDLPAVRFMYT
jgi:hypothetical protein